MCCSLFSHHFEKKVSLTALLTIVSISFLIVRIASAQQSNYETADEWVPYSPIKDPSYEGQRAFVEDLLVISGYSKAEKIEVYQTLPNKARVFRVKLDSITGAFMFIRWNKEKEENYLDNKMIDPGVYYNLKTAQEVLRTQTLKASFASDDVALQAPDQEQITMSELEGLRGEYDLKEDEKKLELSGEGKKKEPKLNFKKFFKKANKIDSLKQELDSLSRSLDSLQKF